jgi:hypothetical protein
VLFLCSAKHADVVSYANASLEPFQDLVDPLLEDVLADVQAKWKALEAVTPERCAERRQ